MKQMKEEQQRRRVAEAKRTREIAQLKKEQRRQEVSCCNHCQYRDRIMRKYEIGETAGAISCMNLKCVRVLFIMYILHTDFVTAVVFCSIS